MNAHYALGPLPRKFLAAWLFVAICFGVGNSAAESDKKSPVTVYWAKQIITMEPALPSARVIAVADGQILGVGQSLEQLGVWMTGRKVTVDDRFADKIIMPGFIDPHVHPLLGAVLFPWAFITPFDWELPGRSVAGTKTPRDYRRKLERAISADETGPFISWGYHELWHGDLDRSALDAIASDRPVFVWHRSFHEIVCNSAGLRYLGIDPDAAVLENLPPGTDPEHIDLASGQFKETGAVLVMRKLAPLIMSDQRLGRGLADFRKLIHAGGITTIADMGVGIYGDIDREARLLQHSLGGNDTPFRTLMVPVSAVLVEQAGTAIAAVARAEKLQTQYPGDKVFFRQHIKLLADGAFFSQLMQMRPPGYSDGHRGAWLQTPEELRTIGAAFWDAGFDLHIHVNGDAGLDTVLASLSQWQSEKPRPDHRTSLEHFGYSSEAQNRRVAALGASVSAQPWYVHVLAEKYAKHGLGHDRASQISRLGSLRKKNVPLALHSDLTMAPARPLLLAWVAATRTTESGNVVAPLEKLSLDDALRAITIDAAFVLRMDDEIGSLSAGKRADFTILEADPYETPVARLKDIKIWGTVFEGQPYPLAE